MTSKSDIRKMVFVLSISILPSCSSIPQLSMQPTENIIEFSGGEPQLLTANQLYSAMIRANFSNEEILNLGPGIRRALARTGGAQIREKQGVIAIFAVFDGNLYLTNTTGPGFIMQL